MLLTTFVLALTKGATLLFGAVLTGLSWRAYRRTADPAPRALAFGIGLVTVGAILGGVLHRVFALRLVVAAGVQSVSTATGFAVLTCSLYASEPTEPSESTSSVA